MAKRPVRGLAADTARSEINLVIGERRDSFSSIKRVMDMEAHALLEIGRQEAVILSKKYPSGEDLLELQSLHFKLMEYGEVTLEAGMGRFLENLLVNSLKKVELVDFQRALSLARTVSGDQYRVVGITGIHFPFRSSKKIGRVL